MLICGDAISVLHSIDERVDCIFADPPDNIGLKYGTHRDTLPQEMYRRLLRQLIWGGTRVAPIVWISFNARWLPAMGSLVDEFCDAKPEYRCKPCVQVFTFGQHNSRDFANNYRPLWRIARKDAKFYPDNVRIPSWRQLNGDKRAAPAGRVPGDVFDFPRVVGNSMQRRAWHPTQLHEELVRRCVMFSTAPGGHVLDPFAGTGTTYRVCQHVNRRCTLVEIDPGYCAKIREEFPNIPFQHITETIHA